MKKVSRSPPVARFEEFAPDTHTAVQVGDRIFGVHGDLFCFEANTLQPIWTAADPAFGGHTSIVASTDRVLVVTARGELILVDALSDQYRLCGRTRLVDDLVDVFSHPAFVGRHVYVRLGTTLGCVKLDR